MRPRYLRQHEIDKTRWDAALRSFPGATIYAESVYLDHMSPGWDALVLDDYAALFPLPWRRKFHIHYVYGPFLTAQLGLFAATVTAPLLEAFLQAIPAQFRLVELPLNHSNLDAAKSLPLRSNYVLPLAPDYPTLQQGYRENIRRNIRKALERGCVAETGTPLPDIMELARAHATDEKGLQAFARLHAVLDAEGRVKRYGVRGKDGQLLASAVFLFDAHTAYYILVGNHPNGRTLGASHLLIDAFIRDHAGRPLRLDFEGSDFRNLAFFYSSFGALDQPYPQLAINRLPWWIRLLK